MALMEQPYTAETDTRGIYLDENEQGGIQRHRLSDGHTYCRHQLADREI